MGVDENLRQVAGLEPQGVWNQFARIAAIPRCSGHEQKIRSYIEEFAGNHSLESRTDEAGNIVVRKRAHRTMTGAPTIVLQGHLDMVCEKNQGVTHDFATDPITLVRDGGWLRARDTTLGADNGIAVAMILALLEDPEAVHGPIEALFTVDEERGLVGATKLAPDLVSGRRLINLDSEEEGTFYIGCAGGQDTEGRLPVQSEPAGAGVASGIAVSFSVTGLQGGHSGSNIHEGRGNAIVLGTRFLWHVAQKMEMRLYRLDGGGLHNAIPREFFAGLIVGINDYDALAAMADDFRKIYHEELGDIEPAMKLSLDRVPDQPESHLSGESTERLLVTLYSLPHGVTSMSRKIPGLVETSTNLAAVHLTKSEAVIHTSQRSTYSSARDDLADRIKAIIEHAGGRAKYGEGYPSWIPDPDAALTRLCSEVYARSGGGEATVTAIHAGLECGVLGEKCPGMEMISFGPNITGAHTPEERVEVESTARIWRFLLELLGDMDA